MSNKAKKRQNKRLEDKIIKMIMNGYVTKNNYKQKLD